jgi:hypothetical protein
LRLAALIDARLHAHREREELNRGRAAVAKIGKERPELTTDQAAWSAAAEFAHDILREDLTKLGYNFSELEKKLGRRPTNEDVAKAHLFHRASGHIDRLVQKLVARLDRMAGAPRAAVDDAQPIQSNPRAAR